MSPGRAARREREDVTHFSERVKVRRATRSTLGRGWGLQLGLHGLGGDEAEDGTHGTAPEGLKPRQAGGAQLHGGVRQDRWQQRGGPSISKASFRGPGQHAAQQRGASPALMFTEGLLWLCLAFSAQTQQQGAGVQQKEGIALPRDMVALGMSQASSGVSQTPAMLCHTLLPTAGTCPK